MTQAESTRLKAFTRKIRDEGSAGFAAGPWDESDAAASARQRQQTRWAMHRARAHSRPQHLVSDRILTWAAIVALITLSVGIVGAWLSYQPNPGAAITRPISLNKTSLERFETRLERMEKRLSTILEPYIRMLNNLDGRLKKTSEELSARLRILEMGTLPATENAYEARLQSLETQLAATMARLDEVSMMLAALGDSQPVLPPAERDSEVPPPAYDRFAEVTPATPAAVPETAWPEPSGPDWTGPAQGNPFLPAPATPETNPPNAVLAQTQQPATLPPPATAAGSTPVAVSAVQAREATARPDQANAATSSPEAVQPEAVAEPPVTPAGDWVINIASYTNEGIARRKLDEMQQQGVAVELVTAEVNGRTVYRARVFGFATRQEASAQARRIREKLGIKETWIAKR